MEIDLCFLINAQDPGAGLMSFQRDEQKWLSEMSAPTCDVKTSVASLGDRVTGNMNILV